MELNAASREIARQAARFVIEALEERGFIQPDESGYPAQMPASMVCDRLGISKQTLKATWRSKGLKVLGRNKFGNIYCGVSVAKYVNNQNKHLTTR